MDRSMKLTKKQIQIMHEMAKGGLCNKDISEATGLDYKTVKHYITRINHKIGTKTRIQIVLWYLEKIGRLIPLSPDDNDLPLGKF